ncbi:pilus assembly PilX family protein [Oceanobacter mangrovi]|uniref:pilus assembly PilX family protein n=1 Tax=Oceanobacter mangrovi TaxID=2862510 RepID=UPI001C8D1F92|nr:hypothetical protein [Oceanobacter mangrovi]
MKHRISYVQRGSALLVSLAVLTAITVVATVAMQQSTLQVRMVNNLSTEKQVLAAANSFGDRAFSNLENSSRDRLAALRNKENQSISEQVNNGTETDDLLYRQASINPFSSESYNWEEPSISKLNAVNSVSASIVYASDIAQDSSSNTGNYAVKNNKDNSSGVSQKYPYIMTTTATDKSGNITSSVQVGLLIEGAASQ